MGPAPVRYNRPPDMVSVRASFVVLLVVTAAAFVALVALGWRSLGGFEANVAHVLRRSSANTAQQLSQQIQRDLRSPIFDLLEQVDHGALRSFDVPQIARTLRASSASHFDLIDAYFVWSVAEGADADLAAAGTDRRVLFYAPGRSHAAGTELAPGIAGQEGFRSNPALARRLREWASEWTSAQRPFALSYVEFEGRAYQVVFHYLFNSNIQRVLGGVEGFLADADCLEDAYFARLVNLGRPGLLPTEGLPVLSLSIFDQQRTEIARSGRSLATEYDAEVEFPFIFFEPEFFESLSPFRPPIRYWTVRTGYEAGTIAALARNQTMPQRFAWLLASAVAAIGIFLTARSAAREMRVSEIKSEFVASISHDLRTPLTKIQLYADTMRMGHATSPVRIESYCQVISAQARKLMHLIQGLMDFSKIEAGVQRYDMAETELGEVVRAAIETFEHELADDYILELDLPETPVPVLGSFDGLQQAFGNLISNAIKYSPCERYLGIRLRIVDGTARLAVTDHGLGIPPDERRRIFRKYYRSSTVSGTVSGSGVGLAIVEHVIRAHRGRVVVTGNDGPGVTFTVTLPLVVGRGWRQEDVYAAGADHRGRSGAASRSEGEPREQRV